MSELKFEGALNALKKPQDSKNLLKILSTIRKEIEWPKNKDQVLKLRQKGCLKYFLKMLNMNKSITDISLSILGNCIMDKGCARDAIGIYNILTPLDQLLKRHPDDDSISGRVFRIIGNMCYHKDQWANIILDQQPDIITHGVEVLRAFSKDNTTQEKIKSEATIVMILRALRLLQNRRTIITLVRNFEVLKVVGSLLIKLSQERGEDEKNEVLLQNIIRLLCDYSKYKFYHSILQMRNTDRGDSLLHLSNVLLLSPKRVVKIVMNFIRISQLKSELPIPEICDKFIDILFKNLEGKGFQKDCIEYVECLCFMLEHPANRNSKRCGQCIPLLIQIVEGFEIPNNKELEICVLIVTTLSQCTYNDTLIQLQLKCKVIEILLKKMQWIVGDTKIDKNHKKIKMTRNSMVTKYLELECRDLKPSYGKRRKCIYDESIDWNVSLVSPLSMCSSDEERYDRASSPCSSISSDYVPSPYSSPSTSNRMENTYSDSDDYSPVCSEADPNEFDLNENENIKEVEMDSANIEEAEELEDDDFKCLDGEDQVIALLKTRLLVQVTNLFKCFTRVRPALPQLGTENILWALLRSIESYNALTSSINPIRVIGKILDSPEYLIPLMGSNFIETIYDLTIIQHQDCGTCVDLSGYGNFVLKKLTALAESESGKGDIAHKLLRGSSQLKEQLVLVIPYIIWDKSILAKLMLDCGGLDTLMPLLQQEASLKERTCKVLCAMATKNLKIANPKDVALKLGKRKQITIERYNLEIDCSNIIILKFDDGSSLEADKELLCDKSDFFNGLFNGHFKESKEDEIDLHNVERKPFECLLQLLCEVDRTADVDVKIDLDTLLDVIVLSDRFLMTDLCGCLMNSVEKFRISRKTVPNIYRWSLESGTNFLRVESVAYALVADLSINQRLNMFETMLNLGYCSELLQDIHKLLAGYLRSSKMYR